MNPKRLAIFVGLLTLGVTLTCFGDPPVAVPSIVAPMAESETIEQLRREVEELKQMVKALRTRLSELEYQGLPQAPRMLPEGPGTEGSAPEGQAPEAAPASYLRFPYDIERANFIWPQWNRQQRVR